MTLGERLKQLRVERGMTAVALAARLCITPVYMSYVEHDHYDTSLGFLARFAEEFGLSLSELLEGVQVNGKKTKRMKRLTRKTP